MVKLSVSFLSICAEEREKWSRARALPSKPTPDALNWNQVIEIKQNVCDTTQNETERNDKIGNHIKCSNGSIIQMVGRQPGKLCARACDSVPELLQFKCDVLKNVLRSMSAAYSSPFAMIPVRIYCVGEQEKERLSLKFNLHIETIWISNNLQSFFSSHFHLCVMVAALLLMVLFIFVSISNFLYSECVYVWCVLFVICCFSIHSQKAVIYIYFFPFSLSLLLFVSSSEKIQSCGRDTVLWHKMSHHISICWKRTYVLLFSSVLCHSFASCFEDQKVKWAKEEKKTNNNSIQRE